MAFLSDPDAINLSKEEVQDAKNALIALKNEHPEVVSICSKKKINDCKTVIASMNIDSKAA